MSQSEIYVEHSRQAPTLRRTLHLWDLVFYGIILIQPTAPMPLFGVVSQEARGHVVTTILIAMCAMLFTAISYGRMARAYPSAGSAYTYVGREIHSGAGLRHRLEHGDGLHDQPDHLHHLVRQGGGQHRARKSRYAGVGRLLRAAVHGAEPARHPGHGAHQRDSGAPPWAW